MKQSRIIIVGSGPAAIAAAWPLVEAGCSVLMLDAADHIVPDPPTADIDTFRRQGEGWRHAFGDDFAGLGSGPDQSPKFATRIGRAVLAPDSDFPVVRARNFMPIRSSTTGGLSKLWGAFATSFDDRDLRDYPLSQSDLAPSYRTIGARIGLSGSADDLATFHGEATLLQPPAWLSPIARQIIDRYRDKPPSRDFTMGLARNAVSTETMDDRLPCNRCGLCLYGCARNAIYDSTQDLQRLRGRQNFHYRPGARVMRLASIGGEERIVEISTEEGRETISADVLILAAGTLNTTALVLSGMGCIGKRLRLLTNPVAAMAFLLPSYLGRSLPPSGFSLGQLSYRLDMDEMSDYATGVFYTADTLPFSTLAEKMPFSRRAALRLSRSLSTALLLATCYLPARFSQNHLSLEIGDDRHEELHITGEVPDETRRILRLATRRLSRAVRRLGAFALPASFSIAQPGADGHLAGTLPMTRAGEALTCTPDGEVRLWQNVFVVDGSCLSDLPAKHCTFTIMANADRIARNLAKRLVSAPADVT